MAPDRLRKRRRVVRPVLIALNLMATWLMLFVHLGESPLVAYVTGRYDKIRQRLTNGGVNYDIAEPEHYRIEDLPTPKALAEYTFQKTPRRDPSSVGESRSICRSINTNAAPLMISNYNDFWGKTARRIQIYVYSISVPHCEVITVKPDWRDQCVVDHSGDATLCHQYVLDNFDVLQKNRTIRMSVVRDTGADGVPLLRCLGRPLSPFKFKADLLAHQTYWSGGEYHVTLQTSDCRGMPLARTNDLAYTLFEAVNVDEACDMLVLLPPGGWTTFAVPWVYSFFTIVLVTRGFVHGLFHTASVNYLPNGLRMGKKRRWLRYALPFMDIITKLTENERSIITFKGSMLVLSDVWMTHWLYIWLSILDAAVNIRATYVTLQVAESLLLLKITLGNVVFMCGALIKITWLMCLLQTFMRMFIKLGARCMRSVRLIRSTTREKIEWNVDGISILLSYRLYYVMLFILTFTLLEVKGDPSFMVRDKPFKVGGYGGIEDIAGFWGSEVACDLITLLGLLSLLSLNVGVALMYTKFKYVADNSLMRLLQKRYVVSGWDGLLAADMLGLNPADSDFLIDGHAYTKLTIGSLLQILYQSGPSGFIHFGGDYIFHDNGFSKDPVRFRYPIPKALAMGLFSTGKGSVVSTSSPATNMTDMATAHRPQSSTGSTASAAPTHRTREELAAAQVAKRSIFDRRLRLVSESYLGKLLFIDATQPGQLVTNKETGHREYEVVDALTTMAILDIKHLMGREKKIRVE